MECGGARGVDVSHKGGRPGFVHADDARTLTVPDYVGNSYHNTMDNFMRNPQAGLLFIDFAAGDLLYVAARAEVLWNDARTASFAGALRFLRYHVLRVRRSVAALPMTWSVPQYAEQLVTPEPGPTWRSRRPALREHGSWSPRAAVRICHKLAGRAAYLRHTMSWLCRLVLVVISKIGQWSAAKRIACHHRRTRAAINIKAAAQGARIKRRRRTHVFPQPAGQHADEQHGKSGRQLEEAIRSTTQVGGRRVRDQHGQQALREREVRAPEHDAGKHRTRTPRIDDKGFAVRLAVAGQAVHHGRQNWNHPKKFNLADAPRPHCRNRVITLDFARFSLMISTRWQRVLTSLFNGPAEQPALPS